MVEPTLPAELAERLAERSDAVAERLESGDGCAADAEAEELQRETIAAVNAGRVPGPLQEELLAAVNALAARIECAPPPEPAEEDDEDDDKGNGKKKGKKKR